MQKNHFLAVIAIAIFTLTIASCKKEVVLTPKELLTAGSWKLIAETDNGVDAYSSKAACEKDNFETYTTAGKYIVDEGATKCSAADPQTDGGDYTLSGDNKTITLKDPTIGFSLDFTILELTATTFKTQVNFLGTLTVQTYAKK